MFYKLFSYLKFLIKSTNQHGVHSPFMFDFVTKGLYKKNQKSNVLNNYQEFKTLSKKEQKILSKIISYFRIKTIYFDLNNISNTLDNGFNLFYINDLKTINNINLDKLNSKQFIIVPEIHQQKKMNFNWQEIIKKKEATVTVDLFYFGLIFFRKEQAKEHFIIRV